MLRCYLMDPDTDVCQTEQPQISYSVDFTAEQSSAMGSPNLYMYVIYWIGRVHFYSAFGGALPLPLPACLTIHVL